MRSVTARATVSSRAAWLGAAITVAVLLPACGGPSTTGADRAASREQSANDGCGEASSRVAKRWSDDYAYVATAPPIIFHYDHGILAGSYPPGVETAAIEFDDVCAQLGHVCLCGAGGFRIAGKVVEALRRGGGPLERGEFILISSRDHAVSDAIAFVLGCTRRSDPAHNQYFIDASVATPRREYHYDVAYVPAKAAVHVVYRKHLLVGQDEMDRLWEIESAFERDPASVKPVDRERYRRAMVAMVSDVLFDRIAGLIIVEPIEYEAFQRRLDALRSRMPFPLPQSTDGPRKAGVVAEGCRPSAKAEGSQRNPTDARIASRTRALRSEPLSRRRGRWMSCRGGISQEGEAGRHRSGCFSAELAMSNWRDT